MIVVNVTNHVVAVVVVERTPCEEKDEKDLSKLVSEIVKCSISRQISHKTVGPNEVWCFLKNCVSAIYLLSLFTPKEAKAIRSNLIR